MDALDSVLKIEERLVMKATIAHIPIGGTFELLPLCNMNCDMCFIRLSPEEMKKRGRLRSADEWLDIAKQMKQAGTLFVLLTGGEPFLYPEFIKLYQGLRALGMIVTINTNGTLITKEIAEVLGKDKPRRVNITLYGASNETYAQLCHNPHGFDQMMRGIQLLKEQHIDIKLNGTIVPENQHEIDDFIRISKELDLYMKMDTYMYPSSRERFCEFQEKSRLPAIQAARKSVEIKTKQKSSEEFLAYRQYMLDNCDNADEDRALNCRAGQSAFWIMWNGIMTPCIFMNHIGIDVFENGFDKAWQYIVEKSQKILLPHQCATCSKRNVCQICAASAYCETGSFDKHPQYMCDYIDEILSQLKMEGKYEED